MADEPTVLAVIPARWGSSRFPGKVLAPLAGRPLIEHVLQRVTGITSDVWITTNRHEYAYLDGIALNIGILRALHRDNATISR